VGRSLIEYFGSAKNIFDADDKTLSGMLSPGLFKSFSALRRAFLSADKDIEKKAASGHSPDGINFITFKEPGFPEKLSEIPDAPVGLWYIGSLPASDIPSVAVIGARECSSYGECVAKGLGAALGRAKVQVISGMARGIDGISQQAAWDEGGLSYGVLGSGADVCYPPSNRRLYDSLRLSGGIISIYPPGEMALPQNFPPRNRIVSGLADAVVVVEARQKSGTLITVDMALEQGREVYAVPGRITDRLSDGCNGLIGQGANVFLSPDIFLAELAEIISAKNILDVWRGRIGEQIVAQELLTLNNKVGQHRNFWARNKAQSPAEVDFIYQIDSQIIPIEVKMGHNSSLKSLHSFMSQSPNNLAIRVWPGAFSVDEVKNSLNGKTFRLINLPFYLVGGLVDVVRKYL
jgi:DNA processing protein